TIIRLNLVGVSVAGLGGSVALFLWSAFPSFAIYVAVGSIIYFAVFRFVSALLSLRIVDNESQLQARIGSIRAEEPSSNKSCEKYARDQLEAITNEEKLLAYAATKNARVLNRIGVAFISASILAPIASVWLYATEGNPGGTSSNLEKDWHILLAGLSFGFLILAAGRGLLRQASVQQEAYYRARRRESYFAGLASAIKIVQKTAELDMGEIGHRNILMVINRVIDVLFTPPEEPEKKQASDSVDFPTKEQLKTIRTALKR
ncbi:MAG: hypothetical protein V3T83_18750, partial [Acidobacteriota bacterium]